MRCMDCVDVCMDGCVCNTSLPLAAHFTTLFSPIPVFIFHADSPLPHRLLSVTALCLFHFP